MPVHHQSRGDHGAVAAAFGEALGVQGDLEGAGHLVEVDLVRGHAPLGRRGEEGVASLVDDVAMPQRLDEGDPPVPLVDSVALHLPAPLARLRSRRG